MTGSEFQAIRRRLDLGYLAFGRRLGYMGSRKTVARLIQRYEARGRDAIPPKVAANAQALIDEALHGGACEVPDRAPAGLSRQPQTYRSGRAGLGRRATAGLR